jgi:arsenite methyltransferase
MSFTEKINIRYSQLAETECCLSCGGAINYSEVAEGEVCVDLGSGKGNDVIRLAEKVGETGNVYGIDISEGMIEKARRNAEKLEVRNVEFIQSELTELPLAENSVNLVISNCTINHVQDKEKLWKEVYRILKPGGRFVVSDIYASAEVPDEYKNDPVAVSECWAGSVTREQYMEHLIGAGFSQIKILEESTPYPKGKIMVSSWTIAGLKPSKCGCCS